MFNPFDLMRLKGYWDSFTSAHPKLVPFLRTVYPAAFGEGTIVDVKITDPSGRGYHYNLRLTAEDMEGFGEMQKILEELSRNNPQ